jgi:hypothetical protein
VIIALLKLAGHVARMGRIYMYIYGISGGKIRKKETAKKKKK